MAENNIAECVNYPLHYIEVLGSKVHYIDEGEGDVILFLHGMPASSFLWRNIIPVLSKHARCIAPDLIGMGHSDKPDIEYTIFDHIHYIEGFINQLALKNITLVMHGWGSVIGFNYAMHHQDNIKAIAFYEAHVVPITEWEMLSLPVQQLATLLKSKFAKKAIIENNYLIEKILPSSILRKLSDKEFAAYLAPFQQPNDRKVLWQYIQDLSLGDNKSKKVVELMQNYSDALQKSPIPKLLIYSNPGFITPIAMVEWCRKHLSNLTLGDVQESLHFAQETQPRLFSELLENWYLRLT